MQELHYVFCSDRYLFKLNLSFLNHNTYTDVITFTLSENHAPIFGEIYISIDRVFENSRSYKSTFSYELHRVMFHGVLHLCGYKDKMMNDLQQMIARENFYLNQYFIK